MKLFSLLLLITCLSIGSFGQPRSGPANAGLVFGKLTTAKDAIEVAQLSSQVKEEVETPVKVKGKVVEVCMMEGCWLKMQTATGNLMVKMKEHSFFVPADINGKTIIADGAAKMHVISVKEQRHFAEDAKKTKEEIMAIKEPKYEIVMNAEGILVL